MFYSTVYLLNNVISGVICNLKIVYFINLRLVLIVGFNGNKFKPAMRDACKYTYLHILFRFK